MVTAAPPITLGEVTISLRGGMPAIGIAGAGIPVTVGPTPESLREWVAFDSAGRYRPLSGYRSLRRGWEVECRGGLGLDEALEIVYPLARRHRDLWERGELRVVPLDETLGRQSGRYEQAKQLSARGRAAAGEALCGGCVRTPVWRGDIALPDGIPCPEACSVLVSLCRETERWERGIDCDRAESSPEAGFADFETPGNEIRETVLAALAGERQEG